MIFVLEDDQHRLDIFNHQYGEIVHTDDVIEAASYLIKNNDIDVIFLDHDLGGAPYVRGANGDGIDLAEKMALLNIHVDTPIVIHSMNPWGAVNIYNTLKNTHNATVIPFNVLQHNWPKVGGKHDIHHATK